MLVPKNHNQAILQFITVLFFLFVIAEIIGAVISNSLSLMGDATAMSIDVVTYIANMFAEYYKDKYGKLSDSMTFYISITVPIFSATLMFAVTLYILVSAIDIIKDPKNAVDDVNIDILLGFGIVNLFIDFFSVLAFYCKGKDVFDEPLIEGEDSPQRNVNMISAGVHVFCDTSRTIFMIVAAVISQRYKYNSALCDAYSALGVSIIILFMVVLLYREIYARFQTHYSRNKQVDSTNNIEDQKATSSQHPSTVAY